VFKDWGDPGDKINVNIAHEIPEGENMPTSYRYLHLMSKASILKINRLFKTDFELFGYEVM
jgi:hypothetical protein